MHFKGTVLGNLHPESCRMPILAEIGMCQDAQHIHELGMFYVRVRSCEQAERVFCTPLSTPYGSTGPPALLALACSTS